MPAKRARQRRFMGAEYARAKAGKKTKTGMAESKIHEYLVGPKDNMVGSLKGNWGDVGKKRQTEARKVGGFKVGKMVQVREYR